MSVVSELYICMVARYIQDSSRKLNSIPTMRMEERENRKLIHSNFMKWMLFSGFVVVEDYLCELRSDAKVVLLIMLGDRDLRACTSE